MSRSPAIRELRDEGWAVTTFSPRELQGCDPARIADLAWQAGLMEIESHSAARRANEYNLHTLTVQSGHGLLYTLSLFQACAREGSFDGVPGFGLFATETHQNNHATTTPKDAARWGWKVPKWATHVLWVYPQEN